MGESRVNRERPSCIMTKPYKIIQQTAIGCPSNRRLPSEAHQLVNLNNLASCQPPRLNVGIQTPEATWKSPRLPELPMSEVFMTLQMAVGL